MSDVLERVDPFLLLAAAESAQDALARVDLTGCTNEQVLEFGRRKERLARRLEPLDHAFVLELESRGVVQAAMARTTGNYLRQLLKIDIGEANSRVRAAHAAGHRRSLLGESLPSAYPLVAAAQGAGDVSARHARVITSMLEKLPDEAQSHLAEVEERLVAFAPFFDPSALKVLADRERDWLDPDGKFNDLQRRRRERSFTRSVRPDGSCTFSGAGTAELNAVLDVVFDALAAPQPETGGQKDTRTPGQRQHDALLDLGRFAVRTGELPAVGGVMSTIVLTMSDESFATGEGWATTSHGAQIPAAEAIRWGGGDVRIMAVALDSMRAITAYGTTHRLYKERERLAIFARDRGCSFPGCGAPPGWTQIHHIVEWQHGGATCVSNGTAACGHHHRDFLDRGWRVVMLDGRPAWIPPTWIDPAQTPLQNPAL